MTPFGHRAAVWVVAGVLGAALIAAPGAARAHGGDPTLVTRLTEVRPALPPEVVVQVYTGYSEQMAVANPTGIPLTVLDPDGTAFLRISSAGVFGNIIAPYLHLTANPPDAPARRAPEARPGAQPRWVPLSEGDTWGWFERRLHPFVPGEEPAGDPASQQRRVLASWQVGMHYGDRPVTVRGVLERHPISGAFRATADPPGDGLDVEVGQGPIPAIRLQVPPGRAVTVTGRDGLPFLRIGAAGVAANPSSAHFRDNPQFQNLPTDPDGWARIADAPAATWLDVRLRYRADRPPQHVTNSAADRGRAVELDRWRIPLTVDGEARTLTGGVEWVPAAAVAAVSRAPDSGIPWGTAALGAATAALLAALAGLWWRIRRGRA